MRLDAVTVSVDYSDYLAQTLPRNKAHFDRLIVVTAPSDDATKQVCRKYSVEFVTSDRHKDNGAPFNRGRLINDGLVRLAPTDWVLHFDADIVLPENFRDLLHREGLSKDCLYGSGRRMVTTFADWQRIAAGESVECRLSRIAPRKRPCGYFQLFHASAPCLTWPWYPEDRHSAEQSDMDFAELWDHGRRRVLAMEVLHLATPDDVRGINWCGRRTKPFR